MRAKIMSCALIGLSLLILVGVVLTAWFLFRSEEQENFLNFNLENGVSQTVEFKDLNMYPGKTATYTMFLFSQIEDDYALSFDFQELEGEILKDYIDVTITINDELFLTEKLSVLLSGDAKLTDAHLDDGIPYTVRIDFTMSDDVGNEPMGTKTLFELVLTATNE